MNPLFLFHLAGLALLGLGLFGLVQRKTLVGMLISVELLLNGAGLSIVASAKLTPADDVLGQLSSLLIMGLAAAEATTPLGKLAERICLAIILVVLRRFGSVETDTIATLRD
jgi:NADH-quinone oxidoreductase subunit K